MIIYPIHYANYFFNQARNNPDNPGKLSRQEEEFLDQYKKITEDLFNSLCLSHLPGEMDFNKQKVGVYLDIFQNIE